jgi:formylglycine-generating enzyme required for sulfatase activity
VLDRLLQKRVECRFENAAQVLAVIKQMSSPKGSPIALGAPANGRAQNDQVPAPAPPPDPPPADPFPVVWGEPETSLVQPKPSVLSMEWIWEMLISHHKMLIWTLIGVALLGTLLAASIYWVYQWPSRAVLVQSDPSSASVAVDGRDAGLRTPARLSLPLGPHSLSLSLAAHHPHVVPQIEVAKGDDVLKLGPYTLDPVMVMARVDSSPPHAAVVVDGKATGMTTPALVSLPVGTHFVELARPGYHGKTLPAVECREGERVIELGSFPLVAKDRALRIVSEPAGAIVRIANSSRRTTPAEVELPVGSHRLTFVLEGYADKEVTVLVEAGDTILQPEVFRLEPLDRIVALSSEPVGAEVSVRRTGESELVQSVRAPGTCRLGAGSSWTLTAFLKGYPEVTRVVDMARGPGPSALHFDLRKPALRTLSASGIVLVWVPPGEFLMGSTAPVDPARRAAEHGLEHARRVTSMRTDDPFLGLFGGDGDAPTASTTGGRRIDDALDERPQHRVVITKGKYVGKTEVTQRQFLKVMGHNPSHFQPRRVAGLVDASDHPVERVSFYQALEFCRRVTVTEGLTPGSVRLPTEAEWEYFARAGRNGRFDPLEESWLADGSGGKTRPVGRRQPNPFLVHDAIGNVREWTSDFYSRDYYAESPVFDPQGPFLPVEGHLKVVRGGGFADPKATFRVTDRWACNPIAEDAIDVGFRVVLVDP